jgi:eukaryotic-like serine/threonine-protein kinase
LPFSEVLDISIQIAHALTAAHEAHLVHRDIKPENIMIRPDGLLKILDFGLAKLVQQENNLFRGLNQSMGESQTAQGVILGTVNYMSPEQAKGEKVDERTDIFSLGVVMYEMITGRTPFAGDSPSETFANLINAQPSPLSHFTTNVANELQRIVTKTLTKDKGERYQTMKALLTDLTQAKANLRLEEEPQRRPFTKTEDERVQPALTRKVGRSTRQSKQGFAKRIKEHKLLIAFPGTVLLLSSVVAWYYLSRHETNVSTFQLERVIRVTSNGNSLYPAISPDGKFIAYILREAPNRLSIHLMDVETRSTKQIFAPSEYRDLVTVNFSPDGNFIYFAQSETYGNGPLRGLYRISVLGGVPTRLTTDFGNYAISRDGARLAFVRNSRSTRESYLMIANADGTGEYRLAARKLSDPFYSLNWSPDGKSLAATVGSAEISGQRMYPVVVSLADGAEREVTTFRWNFLGNIIWLPEQSGFMAIGRDTAIMASRLWFVSYPEGAVRTLTDDSLVYSVAGITSDGKMLVFQTLESMSNIWVTSVGSTIGSTAPARQITTGNDGYQVSYLTDGRLLFTARNNRLQVDIWVMNHDGTQRKQLTQNAGTNESPSGTKDQRYIVFESDRAGQHNIWRMDADGANPKQLTFGNNEKFPAISPDSKWIVYTSVDDSTLWRVPIDGGRPLQLTGKNWRLPTVSPDGKWIAALYRNPEPSAPTKIGIIPFVGGEPVRMLDFPKDIQVNWGGQWTPDGKAFTYAGARDGISNIWKQPMNSVNAVQLTNFKSTDQVFSPSWSPDRKQIVFSRGGWMFDIYLCSIEWMDE